MLVCGHIRCKGCISRHIKRLRSPVPVTRKERAGQSHCVAIQRENGLSDPELAMNACEGVIVMAMVDHNHAAIATFSSTIFCAVTSQDSRPRIDDVTNFNITYPLLSLRVHCSWAAAGEQAHPKDAGL